MLNKYNKKINLKIVFIIFLVIITTSIIRFSLSAKLDNDVEVEPNTELIYYLDVSYNGVDKYGTESNDTTVSEITSDYIFVEDKIPDGLLFNGFVASADKTFGAVSQFDSNYVCSGSVVDDSNGEDNDRKFGWYDYNGTLIEEYTDNWGVFYQAEDIGYTLNRKGYTFTGWSGPTYDKNLNVIYNAKYTPNISANYTVEWYNADGEYIKSPETRTGTVGFSVSATSADKDVFGFKFDETNKNNIVSTTLKEKGTVIRLYFIESSATTSSINDNNIPVNNDINTINEVGEEDYTYNYHGLHYNESTRTVSFKVKNLQAGCKITVGIKTVTPSTIDDPNTEKTELRRDFYNFATARERTLTNTSNVTHAYMGTDAIALYGVKYEYTGDIPTKAPSLPNANNYSSGSQVGVALIPIVEGYVFNGWTSSDVTIKDNSFTMPSKNVTLTGSFTPIDNYNVYYQIEGDLPSSYLPPKTKAYYPNSIVSTDTLKKGDIVDGYRFLGWTSNDVTINDDYKFIMPEKDVTLIGHFEKITYKVEYRFYDTVLPPESNNYLPDTKEYKVGDKVKLEEISDIPGYHFLGWYKESTFIMPENDVIIYGEWKRQSGTFEPTITKEIIENQESYRPGDVVNYKITITNNNNFPIKDVIIKEEKDGISFARPLTLCLDSYCSTPYIIKSSNIIEIPIIEAQRSMEIKAFYTVQNEDSGIITNEVELLGALADNDYDLDTSKFYKSSASFNVASHLKVCKEVNNNDDKVFQFNIKDNNNTDLWLNLSTNECKTIYLNPGTYNIKEIVPQEYTLKDIILSYDNKNINISNNESIDIKLGKNYTLTFKNEYKKKGFFHSDGRIVNKVEEKIKYKVRYIDGCYGLAFEDVLFSNLSEGDATPEFPGNPIREGYTFMGWGPTINPKISIADANDQNEIIYMAAWKKNK